MSHKAGVLVMGAGIQGSCTALELAGRGVKVTLIDQDPRPMNRASLRNEGKIHLGLVYANDPSMATAKLQLKGALTFWPLLSRWIGPASVGLAVSTPFSYLVAEDSLMSPRELQKHYDRVEQSYGQQLRADPGINYLGRRPERLVRPLGDREIRKYFNEERVVAGFSTEERSISTEQLAQRIRTAIAESPNISFKAGHHVAAIARRNGGFCVEGNGSGGAWCLHADQVVNATWEGRLHLDRQMGLKVDGWLCRLKYRAIVKIPPELRDAPSVTMVLGRYGDVVIRPDSTAYLSWYPVAMRGWSHDVSPPESWQDPCRGLISHADSARISRDMSHAIEQWYPSMARCTPLLVDAGIIVAYGKSDVDDKSSGLHQRSQVGVNSVDGYHSLDAGKLTTSPMFARIAADRVLTA